VQALFVYGLGINRASFFYGFIFQLNKKTVTLAAARTFDFIFSPCGAKVKLT
jgi:hypothetical protein